VSGSRSCSSCSFVRRAPRTGYRLQGVPAHRGSDESRDRNREVRTPVGAVQEPCTYTTAVVYPCEQSALAGAVDAAACGLITPNYVGPAARIKAVASAGGLHLGEARIIDAPDSRAPAETAVDSCARARPSCS